MQNGRSEEDGVGTKEEDIDELNRSGDVDGTADESSGATKDDCVDVEVVEDENQSHLNNNQSCWIKLV